MPFKKIAESLSDVLPVDLANDVKKNVRAVVQSSLEKMDLVTREELTVQEKVLARTRSQLEELQQRVTELEDALKRSADS
ncbi:MAG: accessory factor UbiK family protein [Arenicellales bacterium]|nr:accessory factor UbiK family protein [Arenicellales bacterium]MDP6550705.1 accessory factor UbiK family protein [Arenicellales bacterium]MDP6792301.1 accessory factor UbiK family protein [Arenicellales bacterium]MDP6920031.1 accessory factor UbiK family protein [Arenicellales bacterium]